MGHENDSFGSVITGIFDGRQGTDDPLIVGDVLAGIERDIEVYLSLDKFVFISFN